MKYISKDINVKDYLAQLDLKLSLLEVRGDSVKELFYARAITEQLYKGIEEIIEEQGEKKMEG